MEDFNWKRNIPLFAVLLSGAFITILNQTLLGTAIPPIMEDLQLTESKAQWLQSIFMLVNGIMIPITAFLIEKYSTRHLFMTAMGLFTIGTFIFIHVFLYENGGGKLIRLHILATILQPTKSC